MEIPSSSAFFGAFLRLKRNFLHQPRFVFYKLRIAQQSVQKRVRNFVVRALFLGIPRFAARDRAGERFPHFEFDKSGAKSRCV